jgi:carbon starvation protein CstA
MITFIICLVLLVVAYFTYGRYLERKCGVDGTREVPSKTCYDGVDYVPMPKWRTFLIQLLNIAGLGPIFGAVLGATYGPVAFLWITLGGIFFGAMHDYIAGMISVENRGLSLPEIVGKYLGLSVKQFARVFTVFLMVLVGAVFMVSPATLIAGMTGFATLNIGSLSIPHFWLFAILIYYVIATLLPIDKIIGKIYPIFGAALIFMAVGLFGVLLFGGYEIPEMTSFANMKSNAAAFPIIPTMFVTIACGAISGFHATQSPLMARCLVNEKEGRPVFFGAMISESIIALIWAAVAMAFFGGVEALNDALAANKNEAAPIVSLITNTTLGKIGGILALIGVVAAPISSGDTAFRSARLIVADFYKIEQQSIMKRLYICIPLFVVGFIITQMQFDVLWRYFAWANQTLAAITLWAITVYLHGRGKNIYISLIPALFMTFITMDYLFVSPQMLGVGQTMGAIYGGIVTIAVFGAIIYLLKKNEKSRA